MSTAVLRASARAYEFLVGFYPARYRQEFGEEMLFVFCECLRDAHAASGSRGITRLWGRTLVDAGKSLVIEHLEDRKTGDRMKTDNIRSLQSSIARVAIATAVVMVVVIVASLLISSFNWGVFDYVFTAVLLFAAGLAYELITKRPGNPTYRLAVATAVATAALLFFSNLALGVIGSDDEPANVIYTGVIALAILGAFVVRFRPNGMARVMFITALVQAATIVFALAFVIDEYTFQSLYEVFMVNGFFTTLWVVAGLLFRRSGESRYRLDESKAVI